MSNKLSKLSKSLSKENAEIFIKWIVDGLKDVGLEHNEMCLMNRPHSHSADCDCGIDELQDKILEVLE